MQAISLSDVSKTDLAQKLERARAALKNYKQDATRIGKVGINVALAAGGGALSGVLQTKHPKLFGSEVDTDAAAVLLLTGLVAADMVDGLEDQVAALAMGMAGAVAARETMQFMQTRASKAA